MTVFVIHKPIQREHGNSYDVSSAVEHGAIKYIFEDGFIPYRDPERAEQIAWAKLKDFTANDYLLWAGGDPAGMMIAAMVAGFVTDGNVSFLRWDRTRVKDSREQTGGRYVPVKLSV